MLWTKRIAYIAISLMMGQWVEKNENHKKKKLQERDMGDRGKRK